MTLGFNKTGNAYNHLKFKHACSQKDSPQPTPHAERLSRLRYATLPSMDKSYGPPHCLSYITLLPVCVRTQPPGRACHLEETPPRRQRVLSPFQRNGLLDHL